MHSRATALRPSSELTTGRRDGRPAGGVWQGSSASPRAGWVAASTARSMAEDTIVSRLAPICVVRFNKDPGKDLKPKRAERTSTWQGSDHVEKQGWVTMPGATEPASRAAENVPKS